MKGFVNLFLFGAFFGIGQLIADMPDPVLYSSEIDEPEEGNPMIVSEPDFDSGLQGDNPDGSEESLGESIDLDKDSFLGLEDIDLGREGEEDNENYSFYEPYGALPVKQSIDALDKDLDLNDFDFGNSDLERDHDLDSSPWLQDTDSQLDEKTEWEEQEEVVQETSVPAKRGLLQRFWDWITGK